MEAKESSDFTIRTPDGLTVKVVGIGEITEERALFWKPDGTLDDLLSEKVRKHFEDSLSRFLELRYREKNRFIVLQIDKKRAPITYTNGRFSGQLVKFPDPEPEGPRLDLVRVSTPLDQKTFSLDLKIAPLNPKTYDLPFKPGVRATFENVVFEVPKGPIVDVYAKNGYGQADSFYQEFAFWQILIGKRDPVDATTEFSYQALDASKKPFVWVDGLGNPQNAPADVRKAFEESSLDNIQSKEYPKLRIVARMVAQSFLWDVVRLTTNVDIKEIGWIRISALPKTTHRIDGIRLDPELRKK